MSLDANEAAHRLAPSISALPRDARVLITGGSGFIGTNLLEAMRGYATVANVDVEPPRASAHASHWLELDILQNTRLRDRVRAFRPDFVLHAAARTDLAGRRIEDYQINTVGTESLLDALDGAGFGGTALFFSSMLTSRRGTPLMGLGQGNPDTHYGESKVLMEERLRAARPAYRHIVVRPTSIWGPWFAEPYRRFFRMVIDGRYFNPGGQTATKTFGYVSNTVHQVLALLTHEAADNAPIYLGDAPPVAVASWASEIAALAGVPLPRQLPTVVGNLAARGGDIFERVGLPAPLTTRRLRNMREDNVVDLAPIMKVAPSLPFSRAEGTRLTLDWMQQSLRPS